MSHVHDPQSHDRPPWPWQRPTVPPGAMRVSDVERAEVTALLCRHYADGRLDEAEFNERQAKTAAAKTRADLAPLLADLPSFDVAVPEERQRPHRSMRWVLAVALLVVVVWSLSAVTWSATHVHIGWLVPVAIAVLLVTRARRRR